MKGRLRNREGEVVSSECNAQILAEYYAEVQWSVRLITGELPTGRIGEELPVKLSAITMAELLTAVKRLKNGRAGGIDGLSPEIWKCLLEDEDHRVAKWILELCNLIWSGWRIPDMWHQVRVLVLFKKSNFDD